MRLPPPTEKQQNRATTVSIFSPVMCRCRPISVVSVGGLDPLTITSVIHCSWRVPCNPVFLVAMSCVLLMIVSGIEKEGITRELQQITV